MLLLMLLKNLTYPVFIMLKDPDFTSMTKVISSAITIMMQVTKAVVEVTEAML